MQYFFKEGVTTHLLFLQIARGIRNRPKHRGIAMHKSKLLEHSSH